MKNTYKILSITACILVSMACTETNNVVLPGDKPIITAYLAPGKVISLTAKTEIPYTEDSEGVSKPIDGLAIKITGSDGKVFNLKSEGSGKYSSAKNELVGKAGTKYTLEFDYNGRKIKGSTEIPKKPTDYKLDKYEVSRSKIDLSGGGFPNFGGGGNDTTPIIVTWTNPENVYHFIAAENIETNPEQVVKLPDGFELPTRRFTNSPVVGTTSNLIPRSFEYFGKYNIILYRVNSDYADLYRSGGTNTQNISTPPTSIENALGIFTGINADTLRLTIKKK
jgi:hypothetical protein